MQLQAVGERGARRRKTALAGLAAEAEHVAYVTAFLDRSSSPFKKAVDGLAWGSYPWFAAEPERLFAFEPQARGLRRGAPLETP